MMSVGRIIKKGAREAQKVYRSCRYAGRILAGMKPRLHFALSWRIGNEIAAIPVYEAAKKRFPGSRVSVSANFPEFLLHNPYVDLVNPAADDFDRVADIRRVDLSLHLYRYLEKILGFHIANRMPKIYDVGLRQDAQIDAWLAANRGKVLMAMSCEATWNCKKWPLKNYQLLAQDLERRYNAAVADIGLHPEEKIGGFDLKGKTDIVRLIYLMSKVDMFIGNDSGPLHLALALGKRAVGVFGPVLPEYLIEPRNGFYTVSSDIPCIGCACRNIMPAPGVCVMGKPYCVDELSFEEVSGVVQKAVTDMQQEAGR